MPSSPRQVEECRLEEESEADPLVVLVVLLVLVVVPPPETGSPNTGVGLGIGLELVFTPETTEQSDNPVPVSNSSYLKVEWIQQ